MGPHQMPHALRTTQEGASMSTVRSSSRLTWTWNWRISPSSSFTTQRTSPLGRSDLGVGEGLSRLSLLASVDMMLLAIEADWIRTAAEHGAQPVDGLSS